MLGIDFGKLVDDIRVEKINHNHDIIEEIVIMMREIGIFSSEFVGHMWESYAISMGSDMRAREVIEKMVDAVEVDRPIKVYASRKAMDSTVIGIGELDIRIYIVNIHSKKLYDSLHSNRLVCELYNICRLIAYWGSYREADYALAKLNTLLTEDRKPVTSPFVFMPGSATIPEIIGRMIGRDDVVVSGSILLGGSNYVLVYAGQNWMRFYSKIKNNNRDISLENYDDVDFIGEYFVVTIKGAKILIVNGNRKSIQFKTIGNYKLSSFPLACTMTCLYEVVVGTKFDVLGIIRRANINDLFFDNRMEKLGRGFIAYEEYQRSAFKNMNEGKNWKWEYKKTLMPKKKEGDVASGVVNL